MKRQTQILGPKVNEAVLIRTVTHYYTGRIAEITATEYILTDVSWIADTGRFADAIAKGSLSEVEPVAAPWVLVARGAVVDVIPWAHPLPDKQK